MKFNQWTMALAAAGVVSLGSVAQAEEPRNNVLTSVSQTTLSGYVDTSAIWSPGDDDYNTPGRFNDGHEQIDGFNLNVVKLSLENPLDESQWAAGFKVDMLFGPDAVGYNDSLLAFGDDTDDMSIKQAYVATRIPAGNGIDVKMGVFDTIVGYEVYESPYNPNHGRSYAWQFEPTQHTGVLASYQINDVIGISGGAANTHYASINDKAQFYGDSESKKTYMGSVSLTAPEDSGFLAGGSLYLGVVDGWSNNDHDTTHFYVGATIPTPLEGLALGVAFDYADDLVSDDSLPSPLDEVDVWTLGGYVSWQATEKLTLNGRIEYLKGDEGMLFYYGGMAPELRPGQSLDDLELLGLTGTIDYSLWENVISRLEVRYDHSLNDDVFGGSASGSSSSSNGVSSSSFRDEYPDDDYLLTIALNVIYSF